MDELIKEEEKKVKETSETSENIEEKEEITETSEKNIEDMTLTELKTIAKTRGIKGYSTMKKDELISVLK